MADHSSEDAFSGRKPDGVSLPPPEPEGPPFTLVYPTLRLEHSLESLQAHSSSSEDSAASNMAAEERYQAMDASWASLSDVDFSNEDDRQSEHTDVGSLLDVHSTDDVASVASDRQAHGLDEDVQEDVQEDESETDSNDEDVESDRSQECLPFIRESDPNLIDNQWYASTRQLTKAETDLRRREMGERDASLKAYTVTTRMAVDSRNTSSSNTTASGVCLDHLKVMLLGEQVEQFQHELQRKLGDTLVSCPSTGQNSVSSSISRFHVIPDSLGPGSKAEFADLIQIGMQLDFECYSSVQDQVFDTVAYRSLPSPYEQSEKAVVSTLILSNGQTKSTAESFWTGSQFIVKTKATQRWERADLAVICIDADADGALTPNSYNMIRFAWRERIPCIYLRMDKIWRGNFDSVLENHNLCEDVERRPTNSNGTSVVMTLPVHLSTFLNMDSELLSRHITWLIDNAVESDEDPRTLDFRYDTAQQTFKKLNLGRGHPPKPRALPGSLVRTVGIALPILKIAASTLVFMVILMSFGNMFTWQAEPSPKLPAVFQTTTLQSSPMSNAEFVPSTSTSVQGALASIASDLFTRPISQPGKADTTEATNVASPAMVNESRNTPAPEKKVQLHSSDVYDRTLAWIRLFSQHVATLSNQILDRVKSEIAAIDSAWGPQVNALASDKFGVARTRARQLVHDAARRFHSKFSLSIAKKRARKLVDKMGGGRLLERRRNRR